MRAWKILALVLLAITCSIGTFGTLFFMESIALQAWYVTGVVIGLSLGYVTLVKFASTVQLTRSQICAIILVIIAIPIFAYAFIGVRIPQTYWYKSQDIGVMCADGTPITFSLSLNFSTTGVFSAENPVHVHAIINNANVSDLTAHLGAISFTNAYGISESPVISGTPSYGYVVLSQSKNGEYVADGDLIWHQSETCYIIPLPPFQGVIRSANLDKQQLGGEPVLYISSVSDTLSFRSNHTMEQLTYAVIGFSVIMLQPILSAIFPDKPAEKQKNPQQPPFQQEPFYKKHQKEH